MFARVLSVLLTFALGVVLGLCSDALREPVVSGSTQLRVPRGLEQSADNSLEAVVVALGVAGRAWALLEGTVVTDRSRTDVDWLLVPSIELSLGAVFRDPGVFADADVWLKSPSLNPSGLVPNESWRRAWGEILSTVSDALRAYRWDISALMSAEVAAAAAHGRGDGLVSEEVWRTMQETGLGRIPMMLPGAAISWDEGRAWVCSSTDTPASLEHSRMLLVMHEDLLMIASSDLQRRGMCSEADLVAMREALSLEVRGLVGEAERPASGVMHK